MTTKKKSTKSVFANKSQELHRKYKMDLDAIKTFTTLFHSKNKFYPLFLKNDRLSANKQGASHRTLYQACKNGHWDTNAWQYVNPQNFITTQNDYGSYRSKMVANGYIHNFVIDVDGSKFYSIEEIINDLKARGMPLPSACIQTGYSNFHLIYNCKNELTPNIGLSQIEVMVATCWIAGVPECRSDNMEMALDTAKYIYGIDPFYAKINPTQHKFRIPGTMKVKGDETFFIKGEITNGYILQSELWEVCKKFCQDDVLQNRAKMEADRVAYKKRVEEEKIKHQEFLAKKPIYSQSLLDHIGPYNLFEHNIPAEMRPHNPEPSTWTILATIAELQDEGFNLTDERPSKPLHIPDMITENGIEPAWVQPWEMGAYNKAQAEKKRAKEELEAKQAEKEKIVIQEETEPDVLNSKRNKVGNTYWKDHIPKVRSAFLDLIPRRFANRYAEWLCSNLTYLKKGELFISQARLAKELELTQVTVSKHLKILIKAGYLNIEADYVKQEIPRRYSAGERMKEIVCGPGIAKAKLEAPYEGGDTNEMLLEDVRILVHAGVRARDVVEFIDQKMQSRPHHKRRSRGEIFWIVSDWVDKTNKKLPDKPMITLDNLEIHDEDEEYIFHH